MKITKRQLRKLIKEMLDSDHPEEVEPIENVWAGCPEAGNLELDIDHSKAAGGEETTKRPETLDVGGPVLGERLLRRRIKNIVKKVKNKS